MIKTSAFLALSTALVTPGFATAAETTFTIDMKNYRGDGAYLAMYVTDAGGAYLGSLWLAGGKAKYYEHLRGWYAATGGDPAQIQGITGASVGAGRQLEVTLDLNDALFEAGYTLHVDAAVEDMRDSPDEIVIPLTREGSGQPNSGRRYVDALTYTIQ